MSKANEHMERIQQQAETLDKVSKSCIDITNELTVILMDNESQERQIAALNEANERLRERLKLAENRCGDGYMKLPLDADGVPIRIGDMVYGKPGIAWTVYSLCVSDDGYQVTMENAPFWYLPGELTHKRPELTKPEPPDSWEKLEKDVYHAVMTDFIEDPDEEVRDLIRRAKEMVG